MYEVQIKEVKKALQCANKRILTEALDLVNLASREKQVIELVDINRLTQEKTAEILDISVRTVFNLRKNALEKMQKVWNLELIEKLHKA